MDKPSLKRKRSLSDAPPSPSGAWSRHTSQTHGEDYWFNSKTGKQIWVRELVAKREKQEASEAGLGVKRHKGLSPATAMGAGPLAGAAPVTNSTHMGSASSLASGAAAAASTPVAPPSGASVGEFGSATADEGAGPSGEGARSYEEILQINTTWLPHCTPRNVTDKFLEFFAPLHILTLRQRVSEYHIKVELGGVESLAEGMLYPPDCPHVAVMRQQRTKMLRNDIKQLCVAEGGLSKEPAMCYDRWMFVQKLLEDPGFAKDPVLPNTAIFDVNLVKELMAAGMNYDVARSIVDQFVGAVAKTVDTIAAEPRCEMGGRCTAGTQGIHTRGMQTTTYQDGEEITVAASEVSWNQSKFLVEFEKYNELLARYKRGADPVFDGNLSVALLHSACPL